jgi:hypothetical protein
VITEPANLYDQHDFPEAEQALIFHLGLGVDLAQRSRGELDEEHEKLVAGAWRRYRQALSAMDAAGESEDFQAVGLKCRDALIALAKDHAADEWVGTLAEPARDADVKGWADVFAERLADGRVRSCVNALADKGWDLTVWLQHNSDATPDDAELVPDAAGHLLTTFGRLMIRKTQGAPERCPRCGSYRLDDDVEMVEEPAEDFNESMICSACGWRSELTFTSFAEHFKDADIEGYLARLAAGPSDRFHRKQPSTGD